MRIHRLWLTVVLGLGLMLVVTAAGVVMFCNSALRLPRRGVPPTSTRYAPHLQVKTIRTTALDGSQLEAWFMRPATHRASCVIVLHGIGDSRAGSAGFASLFLDAGYAVLIPDSRAHGQSGGELVTYGILEQDDVIRWAKWMQSTGCTAIYGLGESFGGATLIQASAIEPAFRAVVAESSYADLRSAARYRFTEALGPSVPFRDAVSGGLVGSALLFARLSYGLDFDRDTPLKAIARTQTPILLIHGREDRQTPSSHSVTLASSSSRAALWLVPGAGHCGAAMAAPAEFRRRVLDWFADH